MAVHGLRWAPPVAIFTSSLWDGAIVCGNRRLPLIEGNCAPAVRRTSAWGRRSREARTGALLPTHSLKNANGWGTELSSSSAVPTSQRREVGHPVPSAAEKR
jgi:hypothetical protein